MMRMTFWFGFDIGEFLFPGFNVSSSTGLAATCLGVACLSLLCEASKALLLAKTRDLHLTRTNHSEEGDQDPLVTRAQRHRRPSRSTLVHLYETLSYVLYITLAYLLMLSVMTYNVAIFISVIVGSGSGYAIFRSNDKGLSFVEPSNQSSVPSNEIPETSEPRVEVSAEENTTVIVHRVESEVES